LCTTLVHSCRHVSHVTLVTTPSTRITVDFLFFPSVRRSLTNSFPTLPLWLNHVVKGMGMDLNLYTSSSVACAVWDSADAHLISAYGSSIVGIVRESPKKKTIHLAVSRARQSVSAI
jgi:hypothetical protein